MEHTTAKMSCFARAYHSRNSPCPVFADTAAEALLGADFAQIAQTLSAGVYFFLPEFTGTPEAGLRRIVDGQLAPSVLARSALCENALAEAAAAGCRQYVLFAAGYDTFAIRNRDAALAVFELDLPELLRDKRRRIAQAALRSRAVDVPCDLTEPLWTKALTARGYDPGARTFGSMLGLSYYLREADFRALLTGAAGVMPAGSTLCLDYPTAGESRSAAVNRALAEAAGERMQASYAPQEMQALLASCGFAVREEWGAEKMTQRFFAAHNRMVPDLPMAAPAGVQYLLAVRVGIAAPLSPDSRTGRARTRRRR